MFHEKNISKFIKLIPIVFILITALSFSFIYFNEVNSKFDVDSKKIKEELLEQERKALEDKIASLYDYIEYKRSTENILKENRSNRRIQIAYNIASNLYNRKIGIESETKILKEIRSVLEKIRYENGAGYVIYEIKSNLLEHSKLPSSKAFTPLNIMIAYRENDVLIQKGLQKDILQRLSLVNFNDSNSYLYAIDEKYQLLQHTKFNGKIGTDFSLLHEEKETSKRVKKFIIESHSLETSNNTRMIYEKPNASHNAFKISSLKYIKDWDWVVVGSIYVNNLEQTVQDLIGSQKQEYNKSLSQTVLVTFLLIISVSVISFFISRKVSDIFKTYQNRIESQKNALKNINATLEQKVQQKTKELEKLNQELQVKVNDEVLKNRRKDQVLYHQSKMASMGEMLGNIAHQWRQPLSAISTVATGMDVKLEYDVFDKEEAKRDIKVIVDTTQYLSNTIDDFRNFFAENKTFEKCELSELVLHNMNLLAASMKNNHINVITHFKEVLVNVIKNELSQGLLNVLTNAKDVLCERIINSADRFIFINITSDETYAIITIKDSAGGIDDAIINKIYEPYFTTKHQSQGTGIGLYMAQEIIVKHLKGQMQTTNVEFEYEKKNYRGACFTIKIPL